MKYECIKAKSLLSKQHIADGWFHSSRSLNAYRGCEFGCIYCDGRSEYYHVDNFDSHIRVKENAPQILRKELEKMGFTSRSKLETETLLSFFGDENAKRLAMMKPAKQIIGASGGVSDAYQQAEEKYGITKQILEVLLDFELPTFILTKSKLVTRDLDILKEIHKVAFASISFSITLHDPDVKQAFEPKSASSAERFNALKTLRKAGLYGGVMGTPMIPGIGDTYENMRALAKDAKRANAEFILFSGMTLKPGRQKDLFMRVVKRRYPDKYEYLNQIYGKNDTYGHPDYTVKQVRSMLRGYEVCREVGISDRTVRHQMPYEPEMNNRVLGTVLDILFYQTYLLGYNRSKTKPFYELAGRLERGCTDLIKLKEDGMLKETLFVDDRLLSMILQIMDTGTCDTLKRTHELIQEAIEESHKH